MDVELQILKHLPRSPKTTISVVDEYCESYKDMFCEVRSYENITFPLLCKVFKPKGRLKKGDVEKTKIEIAVEIIKELMEYGFKIELVLADSLYGEASDFIQVLEEKKLLYIVSIRKNHGVWMPSRESVRANKWYKFERVFSDEKSEERWIREIIFGRRRKRTYWQITTDTKRLPENSTSWVMTNLQETRNQMKKTLGNLYGLRTWVEYGFRQCKQELGWTDYRLTQFDGIEKWWEMILSGYLMISLKRGARGDRNVSHKSGKCCKSLYRLVRF